MTKNNAILNAVSFRYLLLDCYTKLSLSENELAVCLMLDHLGEQGNSFINADMLSLKMNLSPSEINEIMAGLIKKGFLSFEMNEENKMTTSLAPLENKVRTEYGASLARDLSNSMNKDRETLLKKLISLFEEKFARTLTPLETTTMNEWLDGGYREEEIRNALLDCVNRNKKTVRAVNKALIAKRKQEDIQKEGATGVSDRWDKNIEETVAAAKALWGDENEK